MLYYIQCTIFNNNNVHLKFAKSKSQGFSAHARKYNIYYTQYTLYNNNSNKLYDTLEN